MRLFFLIMAFVAAMMTVTAYKSGYNRAMADAYNKFYDGPEGYCMADKPPHPGECYAGE